MDSTNAVTTRAVTPLRRPRGALSSVPVRGLGLLAALLLLCSLVVASLAVGSKPIPVGDVLQAVRAFDDTVENHLIVTSLRLPRTLLAVMVGVALGLSGALMQGLTRNPLADPGILGVSAGAALAVVLGIFVLGVGSLTGYVWFAFAGAAVVTEELVRQVFGLDCRVVADPVTGTPMVVAVGRRGRAAVAGGPA